MTYHSWLEDLLEISHQGIYAKMIQCFSVLQCLVSVYMTTDGVRKKMKAFTGFVEERIERRLAKPESKPDLCGLGLIHDENGTIMSRDEMSNNAVVFMLGGTETTAAHLAAITYLLLRHPDKMTRLTKELGAAVKCEDDMTVEKLAKVEYLNACIEEGLRIFPPTPAGLPRITPAGDSMIIDGHVIPGGVSGFSFVLSRIVANICRPKLLCHRSRPHVTQATGASLMNSFLNVGWRNRRSWENTQATPANQASRSLWAGEDVLGRSE